MGLFHCIKGRGNIFVLRAPKRPWQDGSLRSMDMWFVDGYYLSHRRIQVRKAWQHPTSTILCDSAPWQWKVDFFKRFFSFIFDQLVANIIWFGFNFLKDSHNLGLFPGLLRSYQKLKASHREDCLNSLWNPLQAAIKLNMQFVLIDVAKQISCVFTWWIHKIS